MSATSSKDYRAEWPSLVREYERLESDLQLLTDFIPVAPDPNAPNYQFGSPRTASFGLDCCTWLETAFKWLLFSPKFDGEAEVVRGRSEREDIALYRRLFEPRSNRS